MIKYFPPFSNVTINKLVNDIQSHSYGVSLAIRDHTLLPTTQHKWTQSTLTLVREAGTRFTYLGRIEGWVDL